MGLHAHNTTAHTWMCTAQQVRHAAAAAAAVATDSQWMRTDRGHVRAGTRGESAMPKALPQHLHETHNLSQQHQLCTSTHTHTHTHTRTTTDTLPCNPLRYHNHPGLTMPPHTTPPPTQEHTCAPPCPPLAPVSSLTMPPYPPIICRLLGPPAPIIASMVMPRFAPTRCMSCGLASASLTAMGSEAPVGVCVSVCVCWCVCFVC